MIATTVLDQLTTRATSEGVQQLVVGAIVRAEDTVLLLQRRGSDFLGSIYELPHGDVQPGESLASALFRTVQAKTGLTVSDVGDYVGSFDFDAGGLRIRQINFAVSVVAAVPVLIEKYHSYRWVGLHEDMPVRKPERDIFKKYRNIRLV